MHLERTQQALRRTLFVLCALALLAAAALSGCARDDSEYLPVSELIGVPKQSSPIVGFSQLGEESSWRMENTQSILDAAEDAGIQLMYENGHQKLENQIKALRSFIAYQVDAIVLAPLVETGWEAVLQEAADAGIPVILEDREVIDAPEGAVVAWTGPDFYAEGRKAAAQLLSEYKDAEGPVNIIELSGTQGSTAAQDRHEGFRATLGARDRYRIIKSVSGDFMLSKGREVMRELLGQIDTDSVDVIFSHNADMTLGAIEAVEEHGLVPGKDIQIVTIEADDAIRELVQEGKVLCAVESSPDNGSDVLDLVGRVLAGEEVEDRTARSGGVITRKSLEQSLPAPSAAPAASGLRRVHAPRGPVVQNNCNYIQCTESTSGVSAPAGGC